MNDPEKIAELASAIGFYTAEDLLGAAAAEREVRKPEVRKALGKAKLSKAWLSKAWLTWRASADWRPIDPISTLLLPPPVWAHRAAPNRFRRTLSSVGVSG